MDKLTPAMEKALWDVNFYRIDPANLRPGTRKALIARGMLSEHNNYWNDDTVTTYWCMTSKGEDWCGGEAQRRDYPPADIAWDLAREEKEHQFNEGVFFASKGAGSDNRHPEFLAGYAKEQRLMEEAESDHEEARGDFGYGTPDPETGEPIECNEGCGEDGKTCINCAEEPPAEHPWNASYYEAPEAATEEELEEAYDEYSRREIERIGRQEKAVTPSREMRMELRIVQMTKGQESRYLKILGQLSLWVPQGIIEALVDRLVIDRCPVCSTRPGKASWAILDFQSPQMRPRWVSYCSERCHDAASGVLVG